MLLYIMLILFLIIAAIVVYKMNIVKLPAISTTGGYEPDFELYLIRHGQTDTNAKGLANTKDDPTPLNETGKEQAIKTGKYLKQRFGKESSKIVIYSSPSVRALETADLIKSELNSGEIIIDDRLIETDKGEFSGKDFSKDLDLQKRFAAMNAEFAATYPDPIDQHIHSDEYFALLRKSFGGDDLTGRLINLRDALLDMHKHPRVIAISHSGIIGLWVQDLVKVSQKTQIEGDYKNGKNCSITYYAESHDRPLLLIPPNTVHLGLI